MIICKLARRCFSTNIQQSDRNFKRILQEFKTDYKKNPIVLKNNNSSYQQYLNQLIGKQEIKQARLLSEFITLQYLDKWAIVTSIGKQIEESLKNANFQKDLQSWLILMNKFNYEPKQTDQHFISYIRNQILKLNKIHLTSYLFNIGQQNLNFSQLQDYILKQLRTQQKKQTIQIICQGFYHQKWSVQFIKNIYSMHSHLKSKRLKSILQLSYLPNKTTITKLQKSISQTATEHKIGELLSYLDYDITNNVAVNEYEIDYLLGNRYIIQYHGFSHYKSNPSETGLQLTTKSKWKQQMLKKRGFLYCDINFMEWNRIIKNTEQRLFLINKIQSKILEQIENNKGTN